MLKMFEPEKLIEGLQLEKMTAQELLQKICLIANNSTDNMSHGYYQQRLGAILILAEKAQDRLSCDLYCQKRLR